MSDFTRLQSNVQKMIDAGAPHEDIDGYLSSEGMTADQFKTQVSAPKVEPYRAQILPFKKDETGHVSFAVPGIIKDAYGTMIEGGEAARGNRSYEEMKQIAPRAASLAVGGDIASPVLRTAGKVTADVLGAPAVSETVARAAGVASDAKAAIASTANMLRTRAPEMSQAEIKAASTAAYKRASDAGVVIKPSAYSNFADGLVTHIEKDGFDGGLHPSAAAVLKRLIGEADNVAPKTLDDMETLRRVANSGVKSAAKSGNGDEVRITNNIVDHIDDFIGDLHPSKLDAGDADVAVPALNEARNLWRVNSKLQNISDILETGENLGDANYVKNQFRSVVRNKRKMSQYSRQEQETIKRIARTGKLEGIGRLAPSLDALGVMKTAGYLGIGGFNPGTALAAGAALGAKFLGQAARKNELVNLQNQVSSGARRYLPSKASPSKIGDPNQ